MHTMLQTVAGRSFRAGMSSSFQVMFSSLKGLKYHIHTPFSYLIPTGVVRGAGPHQHSLLTKLTAYLQVCVISLDYCYF